LLEPIGLQLQYCGLGLSLASSSLTNSLKYVITTVSVSHYAAFYAHVDDCVHGTGSE